jgi:hypothetical protein
MNRNLKDEIGALRSMIEREKVKREYVEKTTKKLKENRGNKQGYQGRQGRNPIKIKDSNYLHKRFDRIQQKEKEKYASFPLKNGTFLII